LEPEKQNYDMDGGSSQKFRRSGSRREEEEKRGKN